MYRSDIISCLLRVTQIIILKRDAIYLLFICENGYHHSFINCELGSLFCRKIAYKWGFGPCKTEPTPKPFSGLPDLSSRIWCINYIIIYWCVSYVHLGSNRALKKWVKALDYISCFILHFFRALPLPVCFITEQSTADASWFNN